MHKKPVSKTSSVTSNEGSLQRGASSHRISANDGSHILDKFTKKSPSFTEEDEIRLTGQNVSCGYVYCQYDNCCKGIYASLEKVFFLQIAGVFGRFLD